MFHLIRSITMIYVYQHYVPLDERVYHTPFHIQVDEYIFSDTELMLAYLSRFKGGDRHLTL